MQRLNPAAKNGQARSTANVMAAGDTWADSCARADTGACADRRLLWCEGGPQDWSADSADAHPSRHAQARHHPGHYACLAGHQERPCHRCGMSSCL